MSAADLPPYDEPATLDQLVFALGQRDEPTVALVECDSLAKRRELEAALAARMPEYQYRTLDVTPYAVTSLLHTLNEHLPLAIRTSRPVTWVVHVHGLENSHLLNPDGHLAPAPLTAQLNLERELLFRQVPYLIVLWGDADFFRTLQREAPDFWHWVTYRFRFEDHTARPVADLPPLPAKRLPGDGNVAERQARIAELRDRYDHLALDDSNKQRLLKDKINILSLLGQEYDAAFLYPQAEEVYLKAIALQERMREEDNDRGGVWFELGNMYLDQKRFPEAQAAYERCKTLGSAINTGAILYQFGEVYREQQQWEAALTHYQQALKWAKKTANARLMGSTYHGLGILYADQQQWPLALENYRQALEWEQRIGNALAMGATHHQLGRAYQAQGRWALALENYQQAINQDQSTGNNSGLGAEYYQIGRLYEEQQRYAEARRWFEKAIENFTKYGHPFLPQAEVGLARTLAALQQEKKPPARKPLYPKRPKRPKRR